MADSIAHVALTCKTPDHILIIHKALKKVQWEKARVDNVLHRMASFSVHVPESFGTSAASAVAIPVFSQALVSTSFMFLLIDKRLLRTRLLENP